MRNSASRRGPSGPGWCAPSTLRVCLGALVSMFMGCRSAAALDPGATANPEPGAAQVEPQVGTAAGGTESQQPAGSAEATATQAARHGSERVPSSPDDQRLTLLRHGRVMTANGAIYQRGDVLMRGRQIAAIGVDLPVPTDARVVELAGKTVTPGLIDTHSHLGVYAAPGFAAHADGNEMNAPVTAQVRAADAYWPQDPQIARARAGGVTTMQILPGSANLIGGRSVTVHTTPGVLHVDQARVVGAPEGLKMACGENPKRVYGDKSGPTTRMGNMAGYRAAFQQAREYQLSWERYREKLAKYREALDKVTAVDDDTRAKPKRRRHSRRSTGDEADDDKSPDPPDPPARDFGLETLAAVLRGELLVHNHCYRADEMLGMLALAREFGFRIRSFHHAVEAYKIADQLAQAGTAASVWADWWGFKAEAFDGIRENAAMVHAAGARAIIHSDSAIGVQHLNQEASKSMWAGRRANLAISDDEALRWITANPAWALGIDDRLGTLEPGKQADIVIWDGDPLSVYTKVESVFIAGQQVYGQAPDAPHPNTDFELGYDPGSVP